MSSPARAEGYDTPAQTTRRSDNLYGIMISEICTRRRTAAPPALSRCHSSWGARYPSRPGDVAGRPGRVGEARLGEIRREVRNLKGANRTQARRPGAEFGPRLHGARGADDCPCAWRVVAVAGSGRGRRRYVPETYERVCESRWGRHFDRVQVGAGPVHAAVADSPCARPRRPGRDMALQAGGAGLAESPRRPRREEPETPEAREARGHS